MGVDLRRAVFLDRDGVINEAVVRGGKPYPPASPAETVIADGAEESLERLKDAGWLLVVVTNQPDVGRGTTTRESVEEINGLLARRLPIDSFSVCYHRDEDQCACRKPQPGLVLEAARRFGIDLGASYLVGDRWRDMAAGVAAGCKTVFIDHGYNERGPVAEPDIRVRSLPDAVDRILEEVKSN